MKLPLHDIRGSSYSFNTTANTVTFSGLSFVLQKQYIFGIVNVDDNEVIYQIDRADRGGSLSGSVLTLNYNVSAMDNIDKLYIVLDVPTSILKAGLKDFTFVGGNLSSIEYPDGTIDTFTYDIDGNLDSITKT